MARPLDPRLIRHLTPARASLGAMLGAGVVASLLVIGQAVAVTELVLSVLPGRPHDHAVRWAVVVAVVLAARGLVGWIGDVAAARAAARVGTALRRRLMAAELAAPAAAGAAGAGDSASIGGTAVLLTRGVSAAEPYLTRYLPALVLAAVLPPLTVVVIATQDLLSAVIVLATLPLVPLFGALVGLATRDRAAAQWREMSALSGHFLDVVRGLPTLVAYRRARVQSARIGAVTDRYRRASMGTLRVAFASSAVLETVATLSVALVAVTVGVRLAGGDLDLRTALVVLLLAPEAYWPLRRVGAEFHAAAEGTATFEAATAVLGAAEAAAGATGVAAPDGVGLDLVDLSVTYPGRRTPALAPFSAQVPAAGLTALVGPSGCGKSTLLAAIAGLVPATGTITAGDVRVGGPAWQRRIAWLPQRPVFVADTVAANLRLGAPTASDAELEDVLGQVALAERIAALPGGLQAPVGEDGAPFSAGERARLALARVVLAVRVGGRRWVLLDEPTAHLDPVTERIVTGAVLDLAREAAVVVVAHQPELVELADLVLRLPAPASAPGSSVPAVTARSDRPGDVPATTASAEPEPTRASLGSRLALGSLLGGLASSSGVALTATAGWLIVQASHRPAVLTMLVAIVGVRAFGLARPALRYAERLVSHDAALRLLAERRVRVYEALVPLVPARLGTTGRRGDVLSSIVDDVDSVVDRELRVRSPLHAALLATTLATAVAAWLLPLAGLTLVGTAVVAGGGAWLLARIGASSAERRSLDDRAALSAAVVEAVQVADELRMWQATEAAVERVGVLSDRLGRASVRAAAGLTTGRLWVLALAGAGIAATALLGRSPAEQGLVSGPMLALLVLLPLALADVLMPLADAGALDARTRAAEDRLDRWERTPPAVRDTVATGLPVGDTVAWDAARARWTPGAPLTAPLSLTLEPGRRIGLVGSSGSGKSTVAALALRFLDPAGGRVALGGADLRSLALDDVRTRIGLVDDDPHVFATTLLENVRLARPDADRAAVEDALRRACLGPWLDALPDGLDTWLGDGHAALSGGERARLGVARAVLAGPAVLVLDEPAAHLDHATATALAREVLGRQVIGSDRAVLWITHSPVGLDLVDEVVTLAPLDPQIPPGVSKIGTVVPARQAPRDDDPR